MEIFNNLDMYSNVDISEYIKNITQQIQACSGLKLDVNNNYDIENEKFTRRKEQTHQMQLRYDNLMRSTLRQLQRILILRILIMSLTANNRHLVK